MYFRGLSLSLARLDKLPVLDHNLGHALESVALQIDIVVLDQGHDELLGAQPLGNGPAVGVEPNELPDVVTGDAGHLLVLAGQQRDEDLQQTEIAVGALHHPRILLEERLGVARPPLQMSGLDLVLVHLPSRHLLVVLVQEAVEDLDVVDDVGVGELPLAEVVDLLHEAAGDHVGEEDLAVDAGRSGGTGVDVRRARGEVAQSGEGDADDLLPGGDGDEVGEGTHREAVLGKVGPDGVRTLELVRHGPEAEGQLVQLLDRGRSLVAGGGAAEGVLLVGRLLPPAGAELAGQVFDPARRGEEAARLRRRHEGRHGRDGQGDRAAARRLELADDPGRQGLQRFDGRGVRRRPAGPDLLGGTGRGQDEGQAQRRSRLGEGVSPSALVQHAQQCLPLIDEDAVLSDVEYGGNGHRAGFGQEMGEDAVQLGDGVVGHDADGIGVQDGQGLLIRNGAGVREAGDLAGRRGRRAGLGDDLEQDARVHGGVAGVGQCVLDGIRLGHPEEGRLLRREAEGAQGVPLDVREGRGYRRRGEGWRW